MIDMPLTADARYLAENCYGYGRWDAPYWFIGLEEGQSPKENNDFGNRAKAFHELNTDGLCDCRKFHEKIKEYRWHNVNAKTGKVDLQSTWKYLMLLLLAYQGKPTEDRERRSNLKRNYQCNQWGAEGRDTGETCVIELSGLPANNSKISKERPEEMRKELDRIRPERIGHIQEMLNHGPQFVVMYGTTQKEHWRKIADYQLQPGIPKKIGSIVFLLTQHPTSHYKKGQKKDQFWIDLGERLRSAR
jgi:hypothetical protein